MSIFKFSSLFLLLLLDFSPSNARPADSSIGEMSANGEAKDLVVAIQALPPMVQGQLALDFLTSFDKTPDELKTQMDTLLAPYPDSQNKMDTMIVKSKEQKVTKFQAYVDSLTNQTLKTAAQNLLTVISNDNMKVSAMCNEFLNFINSLSADDKTKFFGSMPESDSFSEMMKAGNGTGTGTSSGGSENWCQKVQEFMENMATVVKAKMAGANTQQSS